MNAENVTYFDSFGVEHVPKILENPLEIKILWQIFIECKHAIQWNLDYCIGFIDFMFKGKSFLEYTNLFPRDEHKKNEKMILKYFQWWKSFVMFVINIKNLQILKCHILKKHIRALYCLH